MTWGCVALMAELTHSCCQVTYLLDTYVLAGHLRDARKLGLQQRLGVAPLYKLATGKSLRSHTAVAHNALEDAQALLCIFRDLFRGQLSVRDEELQCVAWRSMVERQRMKRVEAGATIISTNASPDDDAEGDADMTGDDRGSDSDSDSDQDMGTCTRSVLLRRLRPLQALTHAAYLGVHRRALVHGLVAVLGGSTRVLRSSSSGLPLPLASAELWLSESAAANFEHSANTMTDPATICLAAA